MKKLVCDRCGLELTEPEDIEIAFEGQEAWEMAARARGIKPRGIIPCKNYRHCGGEIRPVAGDGFLKWRRWTVKRHSQ